MTSRIIDNLLVNALRHATRNSTIGLAGEIRKLYPAGGPQRVGRELEGIRSFGNLPSADRQVELR
jgi:hypothetical protein